MKILKFMVWLCVMPIFIPVVMFLTISFKIEWDHKLRFWHEIGLAIKDSYRFIMS